MTADKALSANSITGKTDVNRQSTNDSGNYGDAGYTSDPNISMKAASSTPAPSYPWIWSYNADGQDLDEGQTFNKTTGVGDVTSYFNFSANTDGGIYFVQDGTAMMTNAAEPYFDIEFDDMNTDGGVSLQKGEAALTQTLTSSITHITVVLSGYGGLGIPSSNLSGQGGYQGLYWTSDTGASSYLDYSNVISPQNINIEGDIIYITFKMQGANDQDGNAWGSVGSGDPVAITYQPWTDVGSTTGTGVTFHGMIGWDDILKNSTAAGNTAIELPIRIS